jgi:hypothetical protein
VNHRTYQEDQANLGYQERLSHIKALHEGGTGYAVLCRAKDVKARPREIASFERRGLMRLGEIWLIDGDEWAAMMERVPVGRV